LLTARQDCREYHPEKGQDRYKQWRREWNYLADLEKTQACAGWCDVGQESLWTIDHGFKDLCTSTVGSILKVRVHRQAMGMFATGLIALVVSIVALMCIQEWMIRLQIEW